MGFYGRNIERMFAPSAIAPERPIDHSNKEDGDEPGGDYRHTTSCDKTSECLFFIESEGRFDLKLVEAPKAPGKE